MGSGCSSRCRAGPIRTSRPAEGSAAPQKKAPTAPGPAGTVGVGRPPMGRPHMRANRRATRVPCETGRASGKLQPHVTGSVDHCRVGSRRACRGCLKSRRAFGLRGAKTCKTAAPGGRLIIGDRRPGRPRSWPELRAFAGCNGSGYPSPNFTAPEGPARGRFRSRGIATRPAGMVGPGRGRRGS